MKSTTARDRPAETEIQHAAYHLWIESGRAHGHALENWLTARESLHQKTTPAPSSGPPQRVLHFPSRNLGPTNPPFPA